MARWMVVVVALAALSACGGDEDAGSTGDGSSSGMGGSSSGMGGSSSGMGGSSAGGVGGGDGGAQPTLCADVLLDGVWKLLGYEAYLQLEHCQVLLFCDLVKGYHTMGNVVGDTLTLTGVATVKINVSRDTLVLLDAGPDGQDLPFERQASLDAIPLACR